MGKAIAQGAPERGGKVAYPRKPLIALSGRHGSDDQIWFSLFHEAAHILLHSKKSVFVDGEKNGEDGEEAEANRWAANFLIPQPAWQRFLTADDFSNEDGICNFATEQGIAPGIVIGRLQHEGLLAWRSSLNRLKVKVRLEEIDDWLQTNEGIPTGALR